jgi:hypothetical protein
MRCMACGGEMILMSAIQDDTMAVPGFEHHTFKCSECQDMERRLVFRKHGREDNTEPVAAPAAPPTVPASTVQDEHVVTSRHRPESDTEPVAVPAAPPTVPASTVQDEHVVASGLFSRVVAKIRSH